MRDPDAMLSSLDEYVEDALAPDREAAPDPLERRADARFVPLEYRGWMVRDDEESSICYCVRIQDIGGGGALIDCVEAPRVGEAVWFYLEPYRDPEHAVEARVAGVAEGPRGGHRVRLEFRAPCPGYLLRRALRGPAAEGPAPAAGPPCGSICIDPAAIYFPA